MPSHAVSTAVTVVARTRANRCRPMRRSFRDAMSSAAPGRPGAFRHDVTSRVVRSQYHPRHQRGDMPMSHDEMTRRDFVSLTVGAGLAAAAGTEALTQAQVVETTVEIRTADG